MRQISQGGIDFIKQKEALRLEAYRDSAGVLTIGYGSTRNVKPGDVITTEQAEQRLMDDLRPATESVCRALEGTDVWLNDNQYAALVSFVFNVGGAAFRQSTLRMRLRAGDIEAVPGEMRRWNKITVNKRKVECNGLKNRRAAEIALWFMPVTP